MDRTLRGGRNYIEANRGTDIDRNRDRQNMENQIEMRKMRKEEVKTAPDRKQKNTMKQSKWFEINFKVD